MVTYNEKYVDKASIKIAPKRQSKNPYRYKLEIGLVLKKDSKDILMVIMMNPSMADDKVSDKTINRITKYAWCKGYKKVLIYNSMPYYATTKKMVAECEEKAEEKVLKENIVNIEKELNNIKGKHLVLATGKPHSFFEKYVWEIHKIIKKKEIPFNVAQENVSNKTISQMGYTFHPIYSKNYLCNHVTEGKILSLAQGNSKELRTK
ncbi:DUF1643 domain-containing protein [Listeria booriae]|uniref:DUF1643 domain-containing protein n=1 Tax=Listeria booriae TaxID=1552123 RepID=UPI0016253A5D|nr:DUF1643 domain-containing protein [Listeria booriae]MBC1227575.1 DUF1643 domain-containing protein [Listeria booriae]